MLKNKRGVGGQLIAMIIIIILLGVMILGLFVWGLVAPPLVDAVNELTGGLQEVGKEDADISEAIDASFVQGNNMVAQLEIVSYLILFGFFIGFIILAFSVRTYPFLLGIWIAGVIVLTFLGLFLSISYTDLIEGDAYLSEVYSSWGMQHFLLSNLPHLIVVLGTIGGIILFVIVTTGGEVEEVNQL